MKKGFTLIELLAVIIILAILALILIPVMSKSIADSKNEANKVKVKEIAKSAQYYYFEQKNETYKGIEGNFYDKISIKGKKPDSAEVYEKNGEIAVAAIFDDKCYYKKYDSDQVKSAKLSKSRVCTINGVEADESCFTYNLINDNKNIEITDYLCSYEVCQEDVYKKTNTDLLLEVDTSDVNCNSHNLKEDEIITDLVIPDKIDNKSVTSIADNAFKNNFLTSVVIPSGVTSINERSFQYNNLTSVVIPNSVTSVGNYAFFNNSLTSVEISNSVTTIGNDAFYNNNLTSVVIPNSVTTIGDGAFSSNNLTSVVIPNSVTTIGDWAFSSNNLTSVEISNSVTTIGNYAFYNNFLTDVVIPNSVTTIGNDAFYYNSLTSVEIPSSVTSIGNNAFSYNNLTSVVIPNSVTSIGKSAFYKSSSSNKNLTTITNKTGKSFDWGKIVNGPTGYNFIKGTVVNSTGNVTIN